ncbi:MAG TPA: FliH/SctL family protein [Rhizomicrobium sp.]|jgi:flagellar assembly protein FliH
MGAPKFTFDTVFETNVDVISDAAKSRKRLTLTQGELDAMLALARNEGMGQAQVRAAEALAATAQTAVAAIENAVSRLDEDIDDIREQAMRVGLAAARKLAHVALHNFPAGEVEAALRDAMHQAIGEPRLVLRAAPQVAEALKACVAEIALDEGFDGRVQISGEPNLRNADCRIEWRGGGLERSESSIDDAISALIARHFPDTSPHTET